jgi:hypothetical protein
MGPRGGKNAVGGADTGRVPDEVPKGEQDTPADETGAVSCPSRESGAPTATSFVDGEIPILTSIVVEQLSGSPLRLHLLTNTQTTQTIHGRRRFKRFSVTQNGLLLMRLTGNMCGNIATIYQRNTKYMDSGAKIIN